MNQLAHQIVQEATGQAEPPAELPDTRNPAAVALSKLGASKGGQARAAALSPARRRAIARKAVLGLSLPRMGRAFLPEFNEARS